MLQAELRNSTKCLRVTTGAISSAAALGGPIVRDKAHYFAAYQRTDTQCNCGLSTVLNWMVLTARRIAKRSVHDEVMLQMSAHSAVRYGRNTQNAATARTPTRTASGWGGQRQQVQLGEPQSQLGARGGRLNEFDFRVPPFRNHIGPRIPSGVSEQGVRRPNINTPQTTEQHNYQFRLLVARHGHGRLRPMTAGASFINEPRLFITFNSGKRAAIRASHQRREWTDSSTVTLNDGDASANIPRNMYVFTRRTDGHPTDSAHRQHRLCMI